MKTQKLLFITFLFNINYCFTQNIGINNPTPLSSLHINNGTFLITGDVGIAPVLPSGGKFIWSPEKRAFRAGSTNSTQWNHANLGDFSFSYGSNSNASNSYSMAGGQATLVTSTHSIGVGSNLTVNGQFSAAFGSTNTASGSGTLAVGVGNIANGWYSTAMGNFTQSNAFASLVIGRYNVLSGTNSWVDNEPIFVIGNGSKDEFTNVITRNNALTVLKNGDMSIAGNTGIGGNSTVNGNSTHNGTTTLNSTISTNAPLKVANYINLLGQDVNWTDAVSGSPNTLNTNGKTYLRLFNNFGADRGLSKIDSGIEIGQILILEYTGSTGGFNTYIADFHVGNSLSNIKIPGDDKTMKIGDLATFIWNGTFWMMTSYSENG